MKQNRNKCFVIGITGGIGSGKTTVSSVLSKMGAYIIDADSIAKSILLKPEVIKKLTDVFGNEIIDKNNFILKGELSKIVFNDKKKLELLNNITHNSVSEEIYTLYKKNMYLYNCIVLDVPIPVKNGFLDISDEIWVIISDMDRRIERVRKRNNMDYNDVISRIKSQMSDAEYLKIATRIIYNNHSIENLKIQILEYYNKIINK